MPTGKREPGIERAARLALPFVVAAILAVVALTALVLAHLEGKDGWTVGVVVLFALSGVLALLGIRNAKREQGPTTSRDRGAEDI